MENIDFKNIWNHHSSNLENHLEVNYTSLKNTNFKHTRLQLNSLLIRRMLEAFIFLLAMVLLINFVVKNHSEPSYVFSGVTLGLFSMIGAMGNLWQIGLIIQLDYSKRVTDFLIQLEKLKLYSLQTLRLLFLSVPFYFSYVIIGFKVLFNFDIYSHANSGWLISNIVLSLLLVPLSIYFVRQLKVSTGRNWVKKIIADNGGKQIDSAIEFINEIVAFKKDELIE